MHGSKVMRKQHTFSLRNIEFEEIHLAIAIRNVDPAICIAESDNDHIVIPVYIHPLRNSGSWIIDDILVSLLREFVSGKVLLKCIHSLRCDMDLIIIERN